MISLQQWRSVIGLFVFKSRKTKTSKMKKSARHVKNKKNDLSDLCGRLFVLSVVFWSFYLEQQLLTQFMTTSFFSKADTFSEVVTSSFCFNFDLLAQASDIESNPGPGQDAKLLEDMLKHFSDKITKSLSSQIQSVRTDLKNEISSVKESVVSLKNELKSINERVKSLEDEQDIHKLDIIACGETMEKLDDRITALEESTERQAQYSRRENLIFHGVAEEPNEDYDKMRKKVTKLLNDNVKDKIWQENDIIRAHRLGDNSVSKKTRPIIVRLTQFHDKLTILKARQDLKKCAIGVSNDLTKYQRDQLQKLKERNEKGYYKNGKLHIVDSNEGSSHDRQKGSGVSNKR